MIKGAVVQETAATGNVFADNVVNFPERPPPFGFVRAKEDKRGRAYESSEMWDGAIACDKPMAGC